MTSTTLCLFYYLIGSSICWKHGEHINNKGSTEEDQRVSQVIFHEKFIVPRTWRMRQRGKRVPDGVAHKESRVSGQGTQKKSDIMSDDWEKRERERQRENVKDRGRNLR